MNAPMDWQRAEMHVLEWLRTHGYPGAGLTATGADGGIDVQAPGMVAQVKAFNKQNVGRPAIQQLAGIAAASQSQALFFTTSAYTPAAQQWATEQGVGLFVLHAGGRVQPLNSVADEVSAQPAHLPTRPSPNDSKAAPASRVAAALENQAKVRQDRLEARRQAANDPRATDIDSQLKRRDRLAYGGLVQDMVGYLHPVEPVHAALEVRKQIKQGIMVITGTRLLVGYKTATRSKVSSFFLREVDGLSVAPGAIASLS